MAEIAAHTVTPGLRVRVEFEVDSTNVPDPDSGGYMWLTSTDDPEIHLGIPARRTVEVLDSDGDPLEACEACGLLARHDELARDVEGVPLCRPCLDALVHDDEGATT